MLVVATMMMMSTVMAFAPSPAAASPTSASATAAVSPGVSDSITRLYLAVYNRPPEITGHEYWVGQYTSGVSLDRIAQVFISSPEWQRKVGQRSDADYLTVLYRNVLDREPDERGRSYWLAKIDQGLTRTDLLLWFSESGEFVTRTGTHAPVPPPPPPFPVVPANTGHGRRIVYSNTDQRVWIVEADNTVRDSYLVSGRDNVPHAGFHRVFSKSPVAWAGHDGITMKHMVRFTRGRRLAIGFHSIPRYRNGTPMQSEDQLGTYQSAGCVRQSDHKAAALYAWAQIGDTVVVLP